MKELGIILNEKGEFMSFGKWKPIDERCDDEFDWHNDSFMNEVYPTKWFKNLNIPLTINDEMHFQNQLDLFARKGNIVIINIKEGTNSPGESSFTIVMPNKITDRQIDFFMKRELEYREFGKDLFAFIDIFDTTKEYDVKEHFYSIDDLYNYLYELKDKPKQKTILK